MHVCVNCAVVCSKVCTYVLRYGLINRFVKVDIRGCEHIRDRK